MKSHHFLAGAAAVLLAASQANAAPTELQSYVDRAQTKADVLLNAAGVDLQSRSVSVRATVAADGRLAGVSVVRSSGSRDVDHSVETVLRKLLVTDAPVGLIGGTVTLNVGGAPMQSAQAH
jgi:TonB family protein